MAEVDLFEYLTGLHQRGKPLLETWVAFDAIECREVVDCIGYQAGVDRRTQLVYVARGEDI